MNEKIIEERARRMAAERAVERRILRTIGYIGVVLVGIVVGLALYDIANGDFPAVSVIAVGLALVLICARRIQFWNIRRKALKM